MSASDQERPTMPDDLDRAYAQAHAMTDASRGPSAAVRANVLAAAQEVAAQAAARAVAAPALTPVAPPVTAVGRGRSAVNLSSWRVRAGAAFCAALLVGVVGWRFDASRRFDEDTQLASAALEMKVVPPEPAQAQVSKDLPPPPRYSAMPVPQVSLPPAPVEVAPMEVARTQAATGPEPAAEPAAPEKNIVVAQADPPLRERALALAPRATPAPVVIASLAPPPTPSYNAAPAPMAPQITTPSVMPPPAPIAPTAAPRDQTIAAAAPDAQRVEITGSAIRMSSPVGGAARVALDQAKKSAPAPAQSLLAASERQLAAPLQAAVDRGDVQALKQLLANPATLVDAPDATGRTALLHAVLAQQVAAVRLLMAAGADPGRADHAGLTPRAAALTGANAEIATLLSTPR
jgi:hypothetical protein